MFEHERIRQPACLEHVADFGRRDRKQLGQRLGMNRRPNPERKNLACEPVKRANDETRDINGGSVYRIFCVCRTLLVLDSVVVFFYAFHSVVKVFLLFL